MGNVVRILLCIVTALTFVGMASSPPYAASINPHTMPETETISDRQDMKIGAGRGKQKSPPGTTNGKDLKNLLDITPDPRDPHHQGFEPRPGVEDGGDMWTFGRAHAAVQHVLQNSPSGNASIVADALDAFSLTHELAYGLGSRRGSIIDHIVRGRAQDAVAKSVAGRSEGLKVLIFHAGLGARTLRCLPPLLELGKVASVHEVVSVEEHHHLSDGSAQLVSHALAQKGDGPDAVEIRHTPLMPGEDTTLEEIVESLQDGYDLGKFDVVLLGGSREEQQLQLQVLLEQDALQLGAILHSDGLARGEASTEAFIEFLEKSGGRFDYEVQEVPIFTSSSSPSTETTSAVIVVTVRRVRSDSEL